MRSSGAGPGAEAALTQSESRGWFLVVSPAPGAGVPSGTEQLAEQALPSP